MRQLILLPLCSNVVNIAVPQVTLAEHTPPGSAVVTVTATDRDSGENGKITYRVMSSTQEGFYIDPNNGKQPRLLSEYSLAPILHLESNIPVTMSDSLSLPPVSRNPVHQSQS